MARKTYIVDTSILLQDRLDFQFFSKSEPHRHDKPIKNWE